MEKDSNFKKLLKNTAFRLRLNAFFSRTFLYIMIFFAVYAVLLLLCRLMALIPDYFNWISLLIPVISGIITGILIHPRPTVRETAKLADEHSGTKDLFLTATMLENSFGEYKPLVEKNAEVKAEKIDSSKIVRFQWGGRLIKLAAVLLLLSAGVFFLPQFDPFGRQLAIKKQKEQKEKLASMDKAVKDRLKTLKKRKTEKNSPEIAKMLEKAKQQFNTMKKSQVKANRQRLKQLQKELSNAWRKKNENKMRDHMERNLSTQSFGMKNKKEAQWRNQLKKNNFSGIQKEARELRKMAQQLSQTSDPAKRKALEKKFRKRLKALSDFMASEVGSQSAQSALRQAMKQMDMSGMKGLSKDALKALNNSMELANRELERLGEMSRDIRDLEMAMQASQLARELNRMKQLKGAGRKGFQDMQDYTDYYNKMVKQCKNGKGKGKGKGDPGGGGGKAEENPDAVTDNKKEISQSKLQAGKILLKWKVKGMGKTGTAREEYLKTVKTVKQGVSEAILKEQVPPGYHESIQKYFDNLKK